MHLWHAEFKIRVSALRTLKTDSQNHDNRTVFITSFEETLGQFKKLSYMLLMTYCSNEMNATC
jgi:hypothetical protein